jgi:hypothetical protein
MESNNKPSTRAKLYAVDHGFVIEADGRRYNVLRSGVRVGNVGGYPAALHLMQDVMAKEANVGRIEPPYSPVPGVEKMLGVVIVPGTEATAELPIELHLIAPHKTEQDIRDDFNRVVQQPMKIRTVSLTRKTSRSVGYVELPRPYRITAKSRTESARIDLPCTFATYHEAITEVRRLFSVPRSDWRARALAVEYRP